MQRPASVTVLGIVNIVFASFGLLGLALTVALNLSAAQADAAPWAGSQALVAWTTFTQWIGVIANCVLFASGIGLLRLRPWGRKVAVIYAVYAVVMALVSAVITSWFIGTQMQGQGVGGDEQFMMATLIVGALIGLGISLLHPGLLWYFMTRPHVIAAFGGIPVQTVQANTPETPDQPRETSVQPRAPIDLSNPYAAPATVHSGANPVPGVAAEQVLETVVPVKNGAALLSYYTGLFSLFPVFGLPLAIVAIISGRRGLAKAKETPEVHGKAHARVGLVCGWLFGLFNLLLTALIVVGVFAAFTSR